MRQERVIRMSIILAWCVALLAGWSSAAAPAGRRGQAAEYPVCHRRRLVVWPRRRVWLQVDQDAGLRPRGAGREFCSPTAFTNNPKCSPCRASLLTGRNTWQLEEAMCHYGVFPAKWPVYPDLLEQAGYKVGHTGKGWGPGDFKAGGFWRNPAGPAYQKYKLKPPLRGDRHHRLRAELRGLPRRTQARPAVLLLGRRPRAAPPLRGRRRPSRRPRPGRRHAAGLLIPTRTSSAATCSTTPSRSSGSTPTSARSSISSRRSASSTIRSILVTSDHGMPFPRVKGQIYEAGFHLPLAIRWGRRVKPGRVVDDFINVRDLAPTFLEARRAQAARSR